MNLIDTFPQTRDANHLAKQLIRSGTSPSLNYGEACAAESKMDFIHKMKICLKELRETYACLILVSSRPWAFHNELPKLILENNELISIFVASIKTVSQKKNIRS